MLSDYVRFRPIAVISARLQSHVMDEPKLALPWKWIGAFCAVLVAYVIFASLTTRTKRLERVNFPIAGVLYSWPKGTTIVPPQPPGVYGKGYVRVYQRGSDFRLI